jgi:hypothetical protein
MKIKDIVPGKTYRTRRGSWTGGELIRVIEIIERKTYPWSAQTKKIEAARLHVRREDRSARDGWKKDFMPGQIECEMTVDEYCDDLDRADEVAAANRRVREENRKAWQRKLDLLVGDLVKAGFPKPKITVSHSGATAVFETEHVREYTEKFDG